MSVTATSDGLAALVAGWPGIAPNTIVFYDCSQGREIDLLDSARRDSDEVPGSWGDVAIQPDGSSMAATLGDGLVIFDERRDHHLST